MSDRFYRAFEERYRGSRELIKSRLAAYLPFVEPLLQPYPAASAIDLGCGRGEWLELLAKANFKPVGVDLDQGMLDACFERGLTVERGDALVYLSALPEASQAVVSAFHVVEHITFEQLQTLAAEALRVLKPGGLLIMETPNPENIVVATRNFYLDPTHQRPIPSALLAFVAEYAGFSRVKTLRLQESKELVIKGEVTLQDVFSGASPDYAVVAQKRATDDVLALINEAFNADYGLSLEVLLSRWDGRFNRLETKAQQAETKAQQAETKAQHFEAHLVAMHNSRSWRVTKPLRDCSNLARKIMRKIKSLLLSRAGKSFATKSARTINKVPFIRNAAVAAISKSPWLSVRIANYLAYSHGVSLGSIENNIVILESLNMMKEINSLIQRSENTSSVVYLD